MKRISRKQKIITAVIVIALAAIGIGIFYMPIQVLNADPLDNLHAALTVSAYGDGHETQSYIIDDTATLNAVLDYLSTCKMHRTLFKKQNYQGLEFEIITAGEENSPDIFIQQNGENSITTGGLFNYKLLNSDEVLENLREIVKYQLKEENK